MLMFVYNFNKYPNLRLIRERFTLCTKSPLRSMPASCTYLGLHCSVHLLLIPRALSEHTIVLFYTVFQCVLLWAAQTSWTHMSPLNIIQYSQQSLVLRLRVVSVSIIYHIYFSLSHTLTHTLADTGTFLPLVPSNWQDKLRYHTDVSIIGEVPVVEARTGKPPQLYKKTIPHITRLCNVQQQYLLVCLIVIKSYTGILTPNIQIEISHFF